MKETETAIKAAQEAGDIIMSYYYREDKGISFKKSKNDIVTKADLEAQQKIISILSKEFPDHGFIGEEKGVEKIKGKTWVIDPLDGTLNFSRRVPHFAVSIGLMQGDEFIIGVIFDPVKKEMFIAEKGNGATLNGKKITVSNSNDFDRLLLATERTTKLNEQAKYAMINTNSRFLDTQSPIRTMGSAALDLCYVACGRFDAYFQVRPSIWDYAAGVCIVQEAGGKVSIKKAGWKVIATNGKIHDKLVEMIS